MANPSICSIPECGKPARTKGLCQGHYLRQLRYGDPMGGRWPINSGICSADGCCRPARARGMCSTHYTRQKRHGDYSYSKHGEALRWLNEHLDYDGDDCLIWPFKRNKSGYGVMRAPHRKGAMTASRMMCILAHGEPEDPSDYACHNCHNGHLGCVHPKHLRWDTNRGNQMDRVEAGNSNRGTRHGSAILRDCDVLRIRSLEGVMPRKEIAAQYGVSPSAIHLIMQRRTWAWLK